MSAKILYLDIETAPATAYIWGLKTRYVPLSQIAEDGYILCFAAMWEGADEVQFFSRWDQGHEAMVQAAWDLLDDADIVVHYNGKNFDIPRLNTEFLINRMGPPAPYTQVDLYQTSRQFRVLSRSMNHMLRLLDLEEKIAHKGMELWTEVMQGVKASQREMEEYNVRDVQVMEELYQQMRPWIRNHPNVALYMDEGEEPKCRHCGSENGQWRGVEHTAVQTYRRWQCNDCGAWSRSRTRANLLPRRDILR